MPRLSSLMNAAGPPLAQPASSNAIAAAAHQLVLPIPTAPQLPKTCRRLLLAQSQRVGNPSPLTCQAAAAGDAWALRRRRTRISRPGADQPRWVAGVTRLKLTLL